MEKERVLMTDIQKGQSFTFKKDSDGNSVQVCKGKVGRLLYFIREEDSKRAANETPTWSVPMFSNVYLYRIVS